MAKPDIPTLTADTVVAFIGDIFNHRGAADPGYFARLSSASVHTLSLQDGPMSASEVAGFAEQENLDAILRVWDDAGKVAGAATPVFEAFAPLLQRVVTAHTSI